MYSMESGPVGKHQGIGTSGLVPVYSFGVQLPRRSTASSDVNKIHVQFGTCLDRLEKWPIQ